MTVAEIESWYKGALQTRMAGLRTIREKLRQSDESRELDQEYKDRHQAIIDEKKRELPARREEEKNARTDKRR